MEEAPENGKESPHSAYANGMNEYQQMHNSAINVFFLLLSSYMFWHCRHPHATYIKISLKHKATHNLQ